METQNSPWSTGAQANAGYGQAQNAVVGAFTSIFSAVGSSRYATVRRFKDEDLVVDESGRDNRAITVGIGSLLLLVVVLIVIMR